MAYTPKFHMPIIGPPPANTPPTTYYGTVTAATSVYVSQAANKGLQIDLSNATYNQIFAMLGGLVTFIPPGKPLPTKGNEPSPGEGSLVLQVQPVDVYELRNILKVTAPGVPTMVSVLYLNAKPDSVRSALEPEVRNPNKLPDMRLEEVWNRGHKISATSRTELEDYYLDQFLLGQTAVFVDGGTPTGKAASSSTSNVALTLRLIDAKGDDLSPLLHLRGMPSYGGAQWTGHPLTVGIAGLPIPVEIYVKFEVAEVQTTTIPGTNTTLTTATGQYVALPSSGVEVSLMDFDLLTPDDELDKQPIGSGGQVHFSISDVQKLSDPKPDLYFLVYLSGIPMPFAGHSALPSEWSTKGWKAVDGSPGYYEDFSGTILGDAVDPLVFRIGLDFHVRLTYEDKSKPPSVGAVTVTNGSQTVTGIGSGINWDTRLIGMMFRIKGESMAYTISGVTPPNRLTLNVNYAGVSGSSKPYIIEAIAPKDIPVSLYVGELPLLPGDTQGIKMGQAATDSKGEAHGVTFDVQPMDSIYFRIDFEMQDAAIKLPRVRVEMEKDLWSWNTSWWGDDRKIYAFNDRSSIGANTEPEILHCSEKDRNVAPYFLKIVRELSTFLFHLTGGAWEGVNNLTLYGLVAGIIPPVGSLRPFSWPRGVVNYLPDYYWDRSTIIHELSHQIVWKEADFGTWNIAGLFIEGLFGREKGYQNDHHPSVMTNRLTAFIEGWPEFIASIFTRLVTLGTPLHSYLNPATGNQGRYNEALGSWVDLGPPPNNRGEESEGSLINALWSIFQKYVVMMATSQKIPESINGDLTLTAPWIMNNPAVTSRFLSLIWGPLKDLTSTAADSDKDTVEYMNKIWLHPGNDSSWPSLRAEFQAFNMAMTVPTLTSIVPNTGSTGTAQHVTIKGANFVLRATSVKVGTLTAINVNVKSSIELEADIPAGGVAGVAAVIVTTLAGSGTLPGGYTFV
jgi:IPT/TIG domain